MLHALNDLLSVPVQLTQADPRNNLVTIVVTLGWLCILAVIAFAVLIGVVFLLRNGTPLIAFVLRKLGVHKPSSANVFLEVTIPATTIKSAYASERLHVLLRNRGSKQHMVDRLAGRKKQYSSELVGTYNGGVRYILVVPASEAAHISRNLISFLPAIKIREVSDYLSELQDKLIGIVELKQGADFVLPLEDHKVLKEHDPMAFITAHMTKLRPGELVAYQIVTAPVLLPTHRHVIRHARKVMAAIANDESLSAVIGSITGLPHWVWFIAAPPLWLLMMVIKFVISVPMAIMDPSRPDLPILDSGKRHKRAATNPYDLELARIVKPKLDQPLFEVSIRVVVASPDTDTVRERLEGVVSALRMFDSPYQTLVPKRTIPLSKRLRQWQTNRAFTRFRERRLPDNIVSHDAIVSSSELSDLYHFANTDTTKTEGLAKSRSKELPVPKSIKHTDTVLDVIVGNNQHGGQTQPIGLTLEQRQKHTYVIGKTGMGKTTLLEHSIYQDMENGKGLAVLDPHGDMFRELLQMVPAHRRKDVIVFDPSDRDYPFGLNILDPGIQFEREEDAHSWIATSVISIFAKLTDESFWGPRMEHILRNATLTALQQPEPNLFTLQRLLTDKKYMRDVADTLTDPVLKQFWLKEMVPQGDMQLASTVAPLTHRIGHFITDPMSRNILLQAKSTIRLAEIMDEGKILLVNLSKGDIGEDQSFFFGTVLTSLIWMAAYQRTKLPERKRRDFFVYIDEFQNFAAPRFAEIASEGRKFHISLIVSHQNIAQLEDKSVLKIMAGNAHTIICLKASPDDEAFILPFMDPEVEKGDIVNLAPHHFFMKTTADESEDAFSGVTVPLEVEGSEKTAEQVIAASRKQYGTPKQAVAQRLETLFGKAETGGKTKHATPKKGSGKPRKSEP